MTQAIETTRAESQQIQPAGGKVATIEQRFYGDMEPYIRRALAGSPVAPEYFISTCLAVYRGSPRLQECDPRSFFAAAYECALLRMPPGPTLGLCYIIPRKIKGRMVAQFQLGYKGVRTLMYRSNLVSAVRSNVVREGEHFEWTDGFSPTLHHVPEGDPEAPIIAAWAVIDTARGGHIPWVMTRAEIDRVKARSDAKDSSFSPWNNRDDFGWMAMKSCIIRAGKLAPVELEIQRAITLDEHADAGIEQGLSSPIDIEPTNGSGNGANGSAAETQAEAFEEAFDVEAEEVEEVGANGEPSEEEQREIEAEEITAAIEGQFASAGSAEEVREINKEAGKHTKSGRLSHEQVKRVKAAYTSALARLKEAS